MKYPKIETLFKRDGNKIIIPNEFTLPEFEYLRYIPWEATEKIDGTNIRVSLYQEDFEDTEYFLKFEGRNNNSDIPKSLLEKLNQLFSKEKLLEVFNIKENDINFLNSNPLEITLFGEGFGNKIAKGGNRYLSDAVNFILFDVKVDSWWLNRTSCEDIASKLNIPIVPVIGYYTLDEAIRLVNKGFKSTIAEDKDYDAEGLVLKTPCGLLTRSWKRLITKIKSKDFAQYRRKYGDIKGLDN